MAVSFVLDESWRFIRHNPDVIYKGTPIILAVYFISPVISITWEWLPWLWATYDISRRIPPEWINGTYASVKEYLLQRKDELMAKSSQGE